MEHKVGPVAQKIISEIRGVKKQAVVELEVWKKSREQIKEAMAGHPSLDEVIGTAGLEFALCVQVINWVSAMLAPLQHYPALNKYCEKVTAYEEEYVPEGPPMSPLTRSFFTHWTLCDLTIGPRRETIASILLAVGHFLKLDSEFLAILNHWVNSRLGLFVHQGQNGDAIRLKEFATGEVREVVCPSGYLGNAGEIWLARVLPPPITELSRSVVMNTPYVILMPGVDAWLEYLKRNLPLTKREDAKAGYEYLLKFGLKPNDWAEYVFEAYVTQRPGVIYLRGLPDVPESRPHSSVNTQGTRPFFRSRS